MNASSKRIRLKTPTSNGFSFKQKYESTIIIAILALQQYFSRTLGAKKGENYVEVGVRRAVAMHRVPACMIHFTVPPLDYYGNSLISEKSLEI